MKKLIFSTLIFIPFIGFNQIVNHFDNESSKWYVASNFINSSQEFPTHLGVKTEIWGFIGDTLIESQNWSKLYSSSDSTFQNNLIFQGLIRSENSKVYYKESGLSDEHLIYDFNLTIGDSVLYNFDKNGTEYPTWIEVIDVGNIELNGINHKFIAFSRPIPENMPISMGEDYEEVWIEGIGSSHNPLYPIKPFMLDYEWGQKADLTCTFINENQYFHRSEYSECYIYDVLELIEIPQHQFGIFPNPVENQLNIKTTQNGVYNIEIINSLGETIIKTELSEAKSSINVENLTNGIYFITIENNNNLQTIKFIKE